MEKRLTAPGPVLDAQGKPNPGWASCGILQYERKAIRAPFYRIKEWDWYQVSDDEKALQFTLGHASYAGQAGVTLFNFRTGTRIFTKDVLMALPFGSLGLEASADADGVLQYDKNGMLLRFETAGATRRLLCKTEGFEADVTLTRENPNSLVVNIPFDESPKAFYYNQKINCMTAKGAARVGDTDYVFEQDAWGLLDWGRGVWPFHNEWYWSNATGRLDGEVFGLNLGNGFGNTSHATENALFYKGALHKLGAVRFELGERYTDPWRLTDADGRLDLTLSPAYDRETKTKLLWVDNRCHQMFGEFTGKAVLDDGTELAVRGITGFAEHAVNNW